jgi:phosphatidylinositol alpha-mannosyltransferase
MKIALVSPYDFAHPGGVTSHVTNLERQFTLMGHNVYIIAPTSAPVERYGSRFIPLGIPRPVPTSGSIARVVISPMLSKRVKEILSDEKFEVIHLHEPLLPMLCTTVLRFSTTVNVGTFHAYASKPSYTWTQPFFKLFLNRWFHRLHGRIAVSRPAAHYAGKHFPARYTIIPNGVDIEHFASFTPPIVGLNDGKLNILFVGRLEKRKGAGYLLKAYRQVKKEIPDSRLLLVGPGTRLRHKYEKMVEDAGLKDVHFIGQVSYSELPAYYQHAAVFCAPSTGQESQGVILLEAMAAGAPIVASSIDGYASVLKDSAEALLVPPKDVNSLADSLIRVLADEQLRKKMTTCGLEKVQQYSWNCVAQKVLDYYLKAREEFQKRNRA